MQRRSRSQAMAAAVERLGDGGDIDFAARAKADLDAARGLFKEEHADLDAVDAARVADRVLGVLRDGAGAAIVVAEHLGKGDLAVVDYLQPLQNEPEQIDAS